MSNLTQLQKKINTIRRRKKSQYRTYQSETLAVKLEQVTEKKRMRKKRTNTKKRSQ